MFTPKANLNDFIGAHLATIKRVRHFRIGEHNVPVEHGIGSQMQSSGAFTMPQSLPAKAQTKLQEFSPVNIVRNLFERPLPKE